MCYLTTLKSCVRSKSLSNSKFERKTLTENETIHHMIINEILKLMESGKIKKPMILTKEDSLNQIRRRRTNRRSSCTLDTFQPFSENYSKPLHSLESMI